ncbi:MAG: FtsW/RodA/SpoVE family cell cycle protein [Oscillospiraceae bacterium]|nr:FtsW/RodA/SpoVE family cell cycle protein [Oscillospiraceae bacterium]
MSSIRDFIRDALSQADHILLLLCLSVNLYGIALIYSATRYDATLHASPYKQLVAMVLGVLIFFLFSQLDLDLVLSKWPWIFAVSALLIVLLAIPGIGHEVGGNRSWIDLKLFSVQPSEIVKITFTLLFGKQLVYLQREHDLNHTLSVLSLCLHTGFFVFLLYLTSSDAGSALVYLIIAVVMLWAAGLKYYWFLLGLALALLGGSALWMMLPENNYWKMRILVCFNHDLDPTYRGFQQTRSLLAIQSGKLEGMGYLQGNLTQATYKSALPARHTDFIFSVCCEELGLIGAAILLLLLTALILRCLFIALDASSPLYGYIAMGFTGMFLFQIILNIGMCLFVLPVIGLTLPFVSYGGSSLVTAYAAMGILSGIKQRSLPSWLKGTSADDWTE